MHSTKQEQKTLSRNGRYEIPKFHSIFTSYGNPLAKQLPLVNEWMDWMFQFSLLSKSHFERRIREASIMTSSYLYPLCKDINRFERLVKWMAYSFICDDHIDFSRDKETTDQIIDEAMECIRRLEAVHVNGVGHNISLLRFKPFTVCVYFVVEDIFLDMNVEQRKRFIKMWRLYCLSITLHALIEYSEKIHIPDQLWYDERIQRFMDLCNLTAIFVNDVYSFEKEYVEENGDMTRMIVNIVGFHVLKYECSIEVAFERSLAIIKEYEHEFKELADSLINDQSISAECKKFIDCVTAVYAGNFALCINCNRYNVIYETK